MAARNQTFRRSIAARAVDTLNAHANLRGLRYR